MAIRWQTRRRLLSHTPKITVMESEDFKLISTWPLEAPMVRTPFHDPPPVLTLAFVFQYPQVTDGHIFGATHAKSRDGGLCHRYQLWMVLFSNTSILRHTPFLGASIEK